MEKKKFSRLEDDGSTYFTTYGSGNPMVTIFEEIDNQIAAKPQNACISLVDKPSGCDIVTYNDGNTPTPERMERMAYVGKSQSDRNGASICGIGQIEGLIAGRNSSTACGTLVFTSVNGGEKSVFHCDANGKTCQISGYTEIGQTVADVDHVEKVYSNMKRIKSNEDMNKLKAKIAAKIYPYASKNPEFIFKFNGEVITPFSVLYDNVNSLLIRRMPLKSYEVKLNGKTYTVKCGGVDTSGYTKLNGGRIIMENADPLDIAYNCGPEACGIFIEVGGVNTIMGGRDSWNLVGQNYHSTKNGIRFWISIDDNGDLKDAVFQESANKSSVGTKLTDIFDARGEMVFKEIIDDIKKYCITWKENPVQGNGGSVKTKKQCEEIYRKTILKEEFKDDFIKLYNKWPEEMSGIAWKKMKTIIKDMQCVSVAQ